MRYWIKLDDTGSAIQSTTTPDDTVMPDFVEVDRAFNCMADYYSDGRIHRRKVFEVDERPRRAGECFTAKLPRGTTVTIFGFGWSGVVDDGLLEMDLVTPGTYRVRLQHPHFCEKNFTLMVI